MAVAGGINTGAAFGIGCYFTTVPLYRGLRAAVSGVERSGAAAFRPFQVASKADAYTERWEEWEGRDGHGPGTRARARALCRSSL